MTKQRRILNLISEVRNSCGVMEYIFLNGSCINMFCILRCIYPEARPWFNIDHVITEIDGKFYDITGQVSSKGYRPFAEFYNKRRASRAFTQMYNYATKSGKLKINGR